MQQTLALILALALSSQAAAADLTMRLKTPAGTPVQDAVVTVYPAGGGAPPRFSWPMRMSQQNIAFEPFVLIVPAGTEVAFPNRDVVRHHVYSFSAVHRFQLKLYGKDESRSVRFDKAGVVALGCNIHDQMIGFIKVVDTAFAAKSAASGEAVVHGLPAGAAVVRIWQPYLIGANNEVVRNLVLREGGLTQDIVLDVREPPRKR